MHAADSPRGYASAAYAEALRQGATVHRLAACGGQLLIRQIPGTALCDATSCYPVFSCMHPRALAQDLAKLPDGLVTLTLVPDPLLEFDAEHLRTCFPVVRRLGDHFIIDLQAPPRISSHHRRKLRRGSGVEVRVEPEAFAFLDQWTGLYGHLIDRAGITGLRRFSREIFADMLRLPGAQLLTGWSQGELLGIDWYFLDQDRAYAHWSAYSAQGYERSVSYPMMAAALEYFRSRARVLDLGGAPTIAGREAGGIAYFKAGWGSDRRPAHLYGVALDPFLYRELSAGEPPSAEKYFPYYRRGEFG